MTSTAQSAVERPQYAYLLNTPLRRPSAGRWVAGVCAAIAHRYRIDPVLVRVIVLVAALALGLSAPGFALVPAYLWGVLLIAKDTDELRLRRAMEDKDAGSIVILVVAVVATFCCLTAPDLALLSLVLLGGLAFAIKQTHDHRVQPMMQAEPSATTTSGDDQAPTDDSGATPAASEPTWSVAASSPAPPTTPPAQAVYQPPTPPQPRVKRHGLSFPASLMVWGVGIVAGAGYYVLTEPHENHVLDAGVATCIAALVVAGAAVVAAALGRRVAILLAPLTLVVICGVAPMAVMGAAWGHHHTTMPSTVQPLATGADLAKRYDVEAREMTLNLAALKPVTAKTSDVEVAFSKFDLVLPSVPTLVKLESVASQVELPGGDYKIISRTVEGPVTTYEIANSTFTPQVTLKVETFLSSVTLKGSATA